MKTILTSIHKKIRKIILKIKELSVYKEQDTDSEGDLDLPDINSMNELIIKFENKSSYFISGVGKLFLFFIYPAIFIITFLMFLRILELQKEDFLYIYTFYLIIDILLYELYFSIKTLLFRGSLRLSVQEGIKYLISAFVPAILTFLFLIYSIFFDQDLVVLRNLDFVMRKEFLFILPIMLSIHFIIMVLTLFGKFLNKKIEDVLIYLKVKKYKKKKEKLIYKYQHHYKYSLYLIFFFLLYVIYAQLNLIIGFLLLLLILLALNLFYDLFFEKIYSIKKKRLFSKKEEFNEQIVKYKQKKKVFDFKKGNLIKRPSLINILFLILIVFITIMFSIDAFNIRNYVNDIFSIIISNKILLGIGIAILILTAQKIINFVLIPLVFIVRFFIKWKYKKYFHGVLLTTIFSLIIYIFIYNIDKNTLISPLQQTLISSVVGIVLSYLQKRIKLKFGLLQKLG